MSKYKKWWDYLPLALAAVITAGLGFSAHADPAILSGGNGADCQLPIDPFNFNNQLDYSPSDENGLNFLVINNSATAVCESVDEKVRPAFINKANPGTLPYILKLKGTNQKRVWCRMEDSDNVVYFTRDWVSLLKVELVGTKLRVTKKLLCVDGKAK